MTRVLRALGLFSLTVMVGCATTGPDRTSEPPGVIGRVTEVATGARMSPSKAVERLLGLRHVYVGETHADPVSHAVQLEVVEALRDAEAEVVIGIEWLPKTAQPALDAWIAGTIDEVAFLERSAWRTAWGHTYERYAAILRWARRHRVPVVALNAPTGLAHKAAFHPADLTPDERAATPPLDTGNPVHQQYFEGLMKHHAIKHGKHGKHGGHGGALDLGRYYRAQLVWDESMSRNLAAALSAPGRERAVAVVFAGHGHVDYGLGIPERAKRLLGGAPYAVISPIASGASAEHGPVPNPAPPPGRLADWLWEGRGEVAVGQRVE